MGSKDEACGMGETAAREVGNVQCRVQCRTVSFSGNRADSHVTVLYYQYGSGSIQPYRILPRRHGSHDHRPLGTIVTH